MRSRSAAILLALLGLLALEGCGASVEPSPFARLGGLSRALRANLRYAAFSTGQAAGAAQALRAGRQTGEPVETADPVEMAADPSAPAIDVPPAALSTVLRLPNASPSGRDIVLTASRDPNRGAAYASTYTWSVEVRNGEYVMTIEFYARTGGTNTPDNPLIGRTTARVQVIPGDLDAGSTPPDRRTVADITPGGVWNPDARVDLDEPGSTNSSISVAPGQVVAAGQTRRLDFIARDAQGNVLTDLPPGAVVFRVQPGSEGVLALAPDPNNPNLLSNDLVRGVSPGIGIVTASLNGVSSPPAIVTVIPFLSITPETATLTLRQTQRFTATVNGSADQAVTWSVQEGAAGGTIDNSGLYTAPATPGTFHVVATSQADPSQSAVATVTVQAGSGTVIVQ